MCIFYKRVIFRVIELKVAFRNFYDTFVDFALLVIILHVKI